MAAVAVAALLVGCGGTDTPPQDDGSKPAWDYSGDFDKLKGGSDIAIASFRVIFVTSGEKRETAEDKGRWGSSGKTSSAATVKTVLTGVDEKLMQQITDDAYAQFSQSLTNKGFTVLPIEKIAANKAFSKIDKRESGKLGTMSGSMKKLMSNDDSGLLAYPTYSPTGLALLDGSFFCTVLQPLSTNLCLAKVADSLDMTVLHVSYVVDFSSFESSSKTGMGYSTNSVYSGAKVSTGQNIHLKPRYTGISAFSKKGKQADMYLQAENPYQGAKAFGESVEATSTTDKAVSGFTNVMGFLGGASGGKSRSDSTVTYEMQAQPAVYKAMVNDLLAASTDELSGNLKYFRDKK